MIRPLRILQAGLLVITPSLTFSQTRSALPSTAKTAEESASCSLSSLPSDIQNRLKVDFGTWKIQEAENLSKNAQETWAGRKPQACPGIAVGLFQNAKTASYAVLLVPVSQPNAAYRLLVFNPKVGEPSYNPVIVEQFDDHGASNYFIRKVPVKNFFNEESKRKFQVQATECIEMIDSAENEYEARMATFATNRWTISPRLSDSFE